MANLSDHRLGEEAVEKLYFAFRCIGATESLAKVFWLGNMTRRPG